MEDEEKSREQLLEEVVALRQRLEELEELESWHQLARARLSYLNAALRAIRGVNQLIARERNRQRLLEGTCQRLIATGAYYNAWIALFEEDGRLAAAAEAGLGRDFLPMRELLQSGVLPDYCQKSLAEPGVVVIEDPSSACADCPLREKHGEQAGLHLRLEYGEKIYGLLAAAIPRELVLEREEQNLLAEIGVDIAFALCSIEVEESLRQSEQRFRQLFDSVNDAVFVCQPALEDRPGRFIEVNEVACRRYGYSREEFLRLRPEDLVAPEEAAAVRERLRELLREKTILFESEHLTRGGRRIPVEIHSRLLELEGRPTILSIVRDITERHQLYQAQKMEAIGMLAGGVAHDFNNLLTTILGNADLALMKLAREDPVYGEIEEVKKAGLRAASLTRQLLAFSRRQVIEPRLLDLNQLISSIEKMLRRLIGEDIELVIDLEPGLWQVNADPGQLDQVIMNLAVNARDAMPGGGRLTFETANVELDEKYAIQHGVELKAGSYVMLAVTDTGIGMDSETQSHIFEPFFTTKEKGVGTGLGLSTVYGIVKQSNGFIWVYSEPGQGATFKIYLPRAEKGTEPEPEEEKGKQLLEGSETVLVVEDDEMVRKLNRSSLERWGYRVLEARDGTEALEVERRHRGPIHLLVTDVVMPGMSGRELANRLISERPEMRVIYISGYTDNAIVRHGILEPGTTFLQKPFSPESLVRKVREILDAPARGQHSQ